jgi:two-component system sensor histidine kinase and response regulator WspE
VSPDLSKFSLWDLFRGEVETHAKTLNDGLLALEERPEDLDRLKSLMRAAHSIKGAARVVRHTLAVDVAHAMEDRLVAAQSGARALTGDDLQRLLEGVDLLGRLSPAEESQRDAATASVSADAQRLLASLSSSGTPAESPATAGVMPATPGPVTPPAPPPDPAGAASPPSPASLAGLTPSSDALRAASASPTPPPPATAVPAPASAPASAPAVAPPPGPPAASPDAGDRSLRLTAQTVTRLMGLAGEAVVATRWLEPHARHLADTKRRLAELSETLDRLEAGVEQAGIPERVAETLNQAQTQLERARAGVADHLASVEGFSLRQDTLTDRLYREVLATRMRPFGDLVEGFPRLVRDLARQLGKKVRLRIEGVSTDVDRDVAALLDAPLNHVVRNALDHGVEPPGERTAAGKPEVATLRLAASHRSGMLVVEAADDGRGVDVAVLRRKVAERGLVDEATAGRLSEQELLEFLFLPGFSTAAKVTEVSGRGVGLDVVLEAMKQVGGRARIANRPGLGLSVTFELPVSLSVMRALIVEVADERCAVPLTRIERVVVVAPTDLRTIEGRQFVSVRADGAQAGSGQPGPGASAPGTKDGWWHVGLATARQVLGIAGEAPAGDRVFVVLVSQGDQHYGLVVDRLVGEEVVAVRPLDPRLGKVPAVSAAALTFDGSPLLVLDVDDMLRSVEQILATGRLARVQAGPQAGQVRYKRILVVDDSVTVREVERNALESHGYLVDVAVDGMDGWNAVRMGQYDLLVTDVDMPRLDGLELVRRVRADPRYRALPIVILSYKDREEDRLRGLDAGASYFLPKSAFQDETFIHAVDELIGGAEA